MTLNLSEAKNHGCRPHPRGSVRRASGFVLTGYPEVRTRHKLSTTRAKSRPRGDRDRSPRSPLLDNVGPLLVLHSKDGDIVKTLTGSEIVVSDRHDRLRISFRLIGRATKKILNAVHT